MFDLESLKKYNASHGVMLHFLVQDEDRFLQFCYIVFPQNYVQLSINSLFQEFFENVVLLSYYDKTLNLTLLTLKLICILTFLLLHFYV